MPLTVWTTVSKPRREAQGPLLPKADLGATWPGLRARSLAGQVSQAIPLGKNVCLANQAHKGFQLVLLPEVDVGGELAVAGVVLSVRAAGEVGSGNPQHIGAVFGQYAGAGRTGQDPGQVQDSYA